MPHEIKVMPYLMSVQRKHRPQEISSQDFMNIYRTLMWVVCAQADRGGHEAGIISDMSVIWTTIAKPFEDDSTHKRFIYILPTADISL